MYVCINIISREISDGRRVSYPVPLISPRTRNISVPTPFQPPFLVCSRWIDFNIVFINLVSYGVRSLATFSSAHRYINFNFTTCFPQIRTLNNFLEQETTRDIDASFGCHSYPKSIKARTEPRSDRQRAYYHRSTGY